MSGLVSEMLSESFCLRGRLEGRGTFDLLFIPPSLNARCSTHCGEKTPQAFEKLPFKGMECKTQWCGLEWLAARAVAGHGKMRPSSVYCRSMLPHSRKILKRLVQLLKSVDVCYSFGCPFVRALPRYDAKGSLRRGKP